MAGFEKDKPKEVGGEAIEKLPPEIRKSVNAPAYEITSSVTRFTFKQVIENTNNPKIKLFIENGATNFANKLAGITDSDIRERALKAFLEEIKLKELKADSKTLEEVNNTIKGIALETLKRKQDEIYGYSFWGL